MEGDSASLAHQCACGRHHTLTATADGLTVCCNVCRCGNRWTETSVDLAETSDCPQT